MKYRDLGTIVIIQKMFLQTNISMNEKTIKEAVRKEEQVTVECKRAKEEVLKSVWATYSVFANR